MSQQMDMEQYRAARPDRIGQGTAIEQSRAAEEVRAAVFMARQFPRTQALSVAMLKEACGQPALAKRAFFSFPRAGGAVNGTTIHLAREIARCWTNLHYGISELRRDDEFRQSEMQAFAWDLESNQRVSTTFIVPHARWADGRAKPLEDFRDVYENNANAGSRRVREQIKAVVPGWFWLLGEETCRETLNHGGGVPFAKRQADMLAAWEKWGISREELERQQDRLIADWSPINLAQLEILEASLRNKTITREEAFPPRRVSDDDISAQAKGGMPHAAVPGVPAEPTPSGVIEDDADGRSWPQVAQPGSGG